MQRNGSHYKPRVVGSLGPTHCCFCQVLMLQSRALPEQRLTLARLVPKPNFCMFPVNPICEKLYHYGAVCITNQCDLMLHTILLVTTYN